MPHILAINGSHRKGKNTSTMLSFVLAEAAKQNCSTELIELSEHEILPCKSCNHCLQESNCSIQNDAMVELGAKMLSADAIVLGSPVYFWNVTSKMKLLIDRTRWMHMRANLLAGKVGAAVVHAGLRNGGQEITLQIIERFLMSQGLIIAQERQHDSGILNSGAIGTMYAGYDGQTTSWLRGVTSDQLAVQTCQQLGRNIVKLLNSHNINHSR